MRRPEALLLLTSFMLIVFTQVEETTREREERLKGWSTFLEGGSKEQQNMTSKPAESRTEATEPSSTTEPEQSPETEPQPTQEQEREQEEDKDMDSTDSSLAGSDEEEA